MVAGVIPVRAVGPARRDAQNPYSSDLGGSSSVDGCLLLTREMRQVYVDAGDIRCRCPPRRFAVAGAHGVDRPGG